MDLRPCIDFYHINYHDVISPFVTGTIRTLLRDTARGIIVIKFRWKEVYPDKIVRYNTSCAHVICTVYMYCIMVYLLISVIPYHLICNARKCLKTSLEFTLLTAFLLTLHPNWPFAKSRTCGSPCGLFDVILLWRHNNATIWRATWLWRHNGKVCQQVRCRAFGDQAIV